MNGDKDIDWVYVLSVLVIAICAGVAIGHWL